MVNFKKNSNQTHRPAKPGKRSKQDRRWTLLFIGNHGRTITLKRFKGIVILAFLVLFVSIGVAVGIFAWNLKIIMDNHGLKDDLKNMSNQVDALRHDKDILMTRLVVAESKVENSSVGKSKEPDADKITRQEQRIVDNKIEETQAAIKKTTPPASKQTEPQQSAVSADSELSVAVENFQISSQPNENRLKVWFKIKNTSPNSRKVSGHTIVVLKGDQTSWLPIPWMPLVDGRPTGKRRGHSFGINYFKTMRLSARVPKSPEEFETATLFVFTREGDLLLEKQYPVNLPPN
ncbi:MAG: hypothetical protein QNL14_04650 [Deltaproteobacteria bacterium]|nr:hypothetical protein [Deltaproteobacteria bacterium]